MTYLEHFGCLVYEFREDTYLTQKALADELGVAQPSISNWESGKTLPRVEYLRALERMAPGYAEEMHVVWCDGRRELMGRRNRRSDRGRDPA